MKKFLRVLLACAIAVSLSAAALADGAARCPSCHTGALAQKTLRERWRRLAFTAPCAHGWPEGYDILMRRGLYAAANCDTCAYTDETPAGEEDRLVCFGYGASQAKAEGNFTAPSPGAAAREKGKALLQQHGIAYSQVVRFPHEGQIYESRGADAVTALEEARGRYPDRPIPGTLGSLAFADLTLDTERTAAVFPDQVPPAKETVAVMDRGEAGGQYHLCYRGEMGRFRISLWPVRTEAEQAMLADVRRDAEEFPTDAGFQVWKLHPEVCYEQGDEEGITFQSLVIPPEAGGEYAFFVHKIAGDDCLESEDVPFTEAEALSIYAGIREGFRAAE